VQHRQRRKPLAVWCIQHRDNKIGDNTMAAKEVPTVTAFGTTRFGLRVKKVEDGFTFSVIVSDSGKQLGNATISTRRASVIAGFITKHS
jgi:uncharacterized protein YqjF (DUF2071 family)